MFEPLKKYATFSGRARRKEYWLFHIFLFAVQTVLVIWFLSSVYSALAANAQVYENDYGTFEAAVVNGGPAFAPLLVLILFGLAMFLPALAVSVRRLHDADFSGWWVLIGVLPAGQLVLFIFFLLDGTAGPNRFGPDPKGRLAPALPA